jgi:hypothetical protein
LDIASGGEVKRVTKLYAKTTVAISPDGRYAVSADWGGNLRLFQLPTASIKKSGIILRINGRGAGLLTPPLARPKVSRSRSRRRRQPRSPQDRTKHHIIGDLTPAGRGDLRSAERRGQETQAERCRHSRGRSADYLPGSGDKGDMQDIYTRNNPECPFFWMMLKTFTKTVSDGSVETLVPKLGLGTFSAKLRFAGAWRTRETEYPACRFPNRVWEPGSPIRFSTEPFLTFYGMDPAYFLNRK